MKAVAFLPSCPSATETKHQLWHGGFGKTWATGYTCGGKNKKFLSLHSLIDFTRFLLNCSKLHDGTPYIPGVTCWTSYGGLTLGGNLGKSHALTF